MAHLLIVEDEQSNAEVAAVSCQADGHVTRIARHGREALACMREARFDLLVVDIRMPVMDGAALIRALRAHPCYCDLPILAVTAMARVDERAELLALGANQVLAKPYRSRDLRAAVSALLIATPQAASEHYFEASIPQAPTAS